MSGEIEHQLEPSFEVLPPSENWPSDWPSWVRKGLREFERAEQCALNEFNLDECPAWAVWMMRELFRVVGLNIRFEDGNLSGPAFLAAFVAYTEVLLESEKTGLGKALEILEKKSHDLDRKITATLTKQQIAYWIKMQRERREAIAEAKEYVGKWLRIFDVVGERKLRICRKIVADAGKQPLPEKTEFFEAYTQGLKRKIFDDDGRFHYEKPTHERMQPSTIYFLMIMNWRVVDEFKDFGELRRWFEKRFGRGSLGNSERLKHLCQRHGYNPGGASGRQAGIADDAQQVPTVVSDYLLMTDVLQQAAKAKK